MLKSEAEHIIRSAIEETDAQFTEEQVQALCVIINKIAMRTVEEAFANWRPSSGGKGGFYA
jgi:alkylhydroperoxidase family enzyme